MSWQKQIDDPLFPDILWSRPENRMGAGKLLIIGGSRFAVSAPVNAFTFAQDAGIGQSRVILPDSTQKTFGKFVSEAYFAPSNPSGGFGKQALAEWLANAAWADGVLLAGDFGRNSETSTLMEKFLTKYEGLLAITHDALDIIANGAETLANRPNTLLILTSGQLQKIMVNLSRHEVITQGMNLIQAVELTENFSRDYPNMTLATRLNDKLIIAKGGKVVTSQSLAQNVWRVETAAWASVWWLQNPGKPLESVSTSVLELLHKS